MLHELGHYLTACAPIDHIVESEHIMSQEPYPTTEITSQDIAWIQSTFAGRE